MVANFVEGSYHGLFTLPRAFEDAIWALTIDLCATVTHLANLVQSLSLAAS